MRGWSVVAVGVLVMAVGCAVDEEATSIGEQEATVRCPAFECSNSEEMLHYGILDANLSGLPNLQGISLQTGVTGRAQIYAANGTAYNLTVVGGRFKGTPVKSVGLPVPLEHAALAGSKIVFRRNGAPLFEIRIGRVRTMDYPLNQTGLPTQLEVYQMSWRSTDGLEYGRNVCNGHETGDVPQPHGADDLMGMLEDETLVFEGDRYDAVAKTTSDATDANWFNFGCAGHTLAKLRLTRNTAVDGLSWQRRQATLKLLVADYCGTGQAFTVAGTPLRWKGDLMEYYPTPGTLEARWNERGAMCLDVPRLVEHPSDVFLNLTRQTIIDQCPAPKPPVCADHHVDPLDGALRVSANPLPPPP